MHQATPPRTHLSRLLTVLRNSWPSFPRHSRMDACQTICSVISFYDEFWQIDLYDLLGEIIALQETPSDILLFAALELKYRGNLAAARQLAYRSKELDPDNAFAMALHANLLREEGLLDVSRACCLAIQQLWPDNQDAEAILTLCDIATQMLPIEHYHILHHAHTLLHPRTYLEIGVFSGKSLAMSGSDTIAVGVDPLTGSHDQQLFHSPARQSQLFKMTSNDFFQQEQMHQLFPAGQFDMAFIDGLHLFEQALMDFVHLERHATSETIIFIHDCLPVNEAVSARKRETTIWTGDVWKIIPCLKAIRPDLEIITFPVSPSGLAMVRRLDPKSRVLATQFDTITSHFFDLPLPESMEERFRLLNVTSADPTTVLQELYKQQGTYHKGETLQ